MEKKSKICKKIIRGRTDKIFCSTDCKNYYHKHLRYAAKQAAIQINEYLKRNYSILLELLDKNKIQVKVYRNILEQKNSGSNTTLIPTSKARVKPFIISRHRLDGIL